MSHVVFWLSNLCRATHLLVDGISAHDPGDHAFLLAQQEPVSMDKSDDDCHQNQPCTPGRGRGEREIECLWVSVYLWPRGMPPECPRVKGHPE